MLTKVIWHYSLRLEGRWGKGLLWNCFWDAQSMVQEIVVVGQLLLILRCWLVEVA